MFTLDLAFPDSWADLSQKNLKLIFKLISRRRTLDYIKLICLFRWNKVEVLACSGSGEYFVSLSKKRKSPIFKITALQIAEIMPFMSWMDAIPDVPVRIEKLGLHKALPADFQEVAFEKFIMAENLYQGYLQAMKDSNGEETEQAAELIDRLGSVLYDKGKFTPWQRVNCFYWFASLKNYLASQFPDFFRPASSEGSNSAPPSQMETMNAMIRALTKGDITKEGDILAMDTWRALSELNAQAREYRELNNKFHKK